MSEIEDKYELVYSDSIHFLRGPSDREHSAASKTKTAHNKPGVLSAKQLKKARNQEKRSLAVKKAIERERLKTHLSSHAIPISLYMDNNEVAERLIQRYYSYNSILSNHAWLEKAFGQERFQLILQLVKTLIDEGPERKMPLEDNRPTVSSPDSTVTSPAILSGPVPSKKNYYMQSRVVKVEKGHVNQNTPQNSILSTEKSFVRKSISEWHRLYEGHEHHICCKPFRCSCCGELFGTRQGFRMDLTDDIFCKNCMNEIFGKKDTGWMNIVYTNMGHKR